MKQIYELWESIGYNTTTLIISLKELLEKFKDVSISEDIIEDLPIPNIDTIENTSEGDNTMRMVLASQSIEVNKKFNIYYHPSNRGFRNHKYIGLYSGKAIRAIGEIENIVDCNRDENGKFAINWSSYDVTTEQKQRIMHAIDEASERDWYLSQGHIFFLVKEFQDLKYVKTSMRAPMGQRYFNLKNELNIKKLPALYEIVKLLNKKTWK